MTHSWSRWTPYIAVIALLFAMPHGASAFGSGDDRGVVGFKSLLLFTGARTAALGGAGVAIPRDLSQLAINPASVATTTRPVAAFSATNYVLDIIPAGGIVSYPTSTGVWSVAMHGITYGDFQRVNTTAGEDGTFGANDFALDVGYARSFGHGISGGASVGWIHSSIDSYSASALLFGIGVLWEFNDNATTLGASATNVGTAISSYIGGNDGMKDEVPTMLRVGATHRPEHFPVPLTLITDVELPRDDEATLNVGAEIRPVEMLTLRIGYDALVRYVSSEHSDKSGISLDDRHTSNFGGIGLRFGFGLNWREYGLDYTYAPVGPFGSVHQLTARVSW